MQRNVKSHGGIKSTFLEALMLESEVFSLIEYCKEIDRGIDLDADKAIWQWFIKCNERGPKAKVKTTGLNNEVALFTMSIDIPPTKRLQCHSNETLKREN